MKIQKVQFQNFRNLEPMSLELSQGFTLVCGKNGQGKSNFLECIHFLCQGYSPKTNKNQDMIAWGTGQLMAVLEGTARMRPHRHGIELSKDSHRIKVDGEELSSYSRLMGHFGIVLLGPEDLEIVRGGPQHRRKFVDALLCQQSPQYMDALKRYLKSLKQRNALLKIEGLKRDDYWEAVTWQWARDAAFVVQMRQEMLPLFIDPFKELYGRIANDAEKAHLVYRNNFLGSRDHLSEAYMHFAHDHFEQEKREGSSMEGPHRDEILLMLSGKNLRQFGSQGQCRSAALALKLAAAKMLEMVMGEEPILLLDDVFAELDSYRQAQLSEVVKQFTQVIVASPETNHIPFHCDRILRVERGQIHE